MSLSRQTFTRPGVNAPDLAALANAIRTAVGDPFYLTAQVAGGIVTVFVEKPSAWQPTEITAVQASVTAVGDDTPQSEAQAFIDTMPIWAQALALALVDEINRLRTQPTTTFPSVTPAQALNAIRAKAGTL